MVDFNANEISLKGPSIQKVNDNWLLRVKKENEAER